MAELIAHYRRDASANELQPRIGIINQSRGKIEVERIPVTTGQTMPRERLDLYYGDGMALWVNEWIEAVSGLNKATYALRRILFILY